MRHLGLVFALVVPAALVVLAPPLAHGGDVLPPPDRHQSGPGAQRAGVTTMSAYGAGVGSTQMLRK